MSANLPAQPRPDSTSINSLIAAGVEAGVEKALARIAESGGLLPVRQQWLRAKAAAVYLGIDIVTMAKWRTAGVGPKFNTIGTRPYYHVDDLDAFLRGNGANLREGAR
jgi:hypothetical protein